MNHLNSWIIYLFKLHSLKKGSNVELKLIGEIIRLKLKRKKKRKIKRFKKTLLRISFNRFCAQGNLVLCKTLLNQRHHLVSIYPLNKV
jgi:hypothetical protein